MSLFAPTDMAGFVNERVVGLSVQSSTTTLLPVDEACKLTTAVPTGTQEVYVKKGKIHWLSDHQASEWTNQILQQCRANVWMSREPWIQNVKMEQFIENVGDQILQIYCKLSKSCQQYTSKSFSSTRSSYLSKSNSLKATSHLTL